MSSYEKILKYFIEPGAYDYVSNHKKNFKMAMNMSSKNKFIKDSTNLDKEFFNTGGELIKKYTYVKKLLTIQK